MDDKKRYPLNDALAVADELKAALEPACLRFMVVGSVRRLKPTIGDIEVLFTPRVTTGPDPQSLFPDSTVQVDEADLAIWLLCANGVLSRRMHKGGTSWGVFNKLAVHVATGIPVDLFRAVESNWWNLLVCRTGPAESNIRVCEAAATKSWKWNPYGEGFYFLDSGLLARRSTSERSVFESVGLPYRQPEERW